MSLKFKKEVWKLLPLLIGAASLIAMTGSAALAGEVKTGACCGSDKAVCEVLTEKECADAGGAYQGDGTACQDNKGVDICEVDFGFCHNIGGPIANSDLTLGANCDGLEDCQAWLALLDEADFNVANPLFEAALAACIAAGDLDCTKIFAGHFIGATGEKALESHIEHGDGVSVYGFSKVHLSAHGYANLECFGIREIDDPGN